jgi:hypothetical protein
MLEIKFLPILEILELEKSVKLYIIKYALEFTVS